MKKTAEWHEARRLGIGGSDANIIMDGDNDAILRLWREKRGESESEDLSWVLPVQIGSVTEELNSRWFEYETGLLITDRNSMRVHPSIQYMRCELDGVVSEGLADSVPGKAIFEAKHINAFGNPDDAVIKYYPQLTHNMIVSGLNMAHLSVFHGTQKWVKFTIDLDPFYGEVLLDRERQFWECVQSGEPPVDMPPIPVPTPHEDMREVDYSASNEFGDFAGQWLENKSAAKKFGEAEKGLKGLVEADTKRAFGHGVEIKRSKSGALSIKQEKD